MATSKRKPAPKKSNTKSKKAVVSKPSKYSVRGFSLRTKLLFVLVVAAVGGYFLFTSFADTTSNDMGILVGMGTGGATAASRDASGNVDASGAPLSFQVSTDNMLECTNVNSGNITTAQLTADQTSDIANRVINAGIQTQSDTINANGQGVLNSTWVRVATNGVTKTVNIVGTLESTPFGRAVSAIARDVCHQANKPVNSQASANGTKKLDKVQGQALAKKIEDTLNAKVYASGFGPRMETAQYVGLDYWRVKNGVTRQLHATVCLRDRARAWAQHMAAVNTMYHYGHLFDGTGYSYSIDSYCGKGSWNYAGENIGWNSVRTLDGVADLVDLMATEQPPNDGHRQNILSTHYANYGAGAYFDDTNGKIWIVQDFATFNFSESTYTPFTDWTINGSATVSSSTTAAAGTIYVKPGQDVNYHYKIVDAGPSEATYTQYRIWKHYAADGTLLDSSDGHAQSTESTRWTHYYGDYTSATGAVTIPTTAKNGEKFCRAIHYNNATGPSTSTDTSNYACAVVKI